MPHLSTLAKEYRKQTTILGIDVMEKKTTPIEKVKNFVDSMGMRMDYHVAAQDSNFMVARWIEASGEQDNGIPTTFVVNSEGLLAWIGHPGDLDDVLQKIVNKTWDLQEFIAKRKEEKRLRKQDDSARLVLNDYVGDANKHDYWGRPDSALLVIKQIVTKEPKLKFTPFIASHTFAFLLKIDPHKAYEYGKIALVTPTYENPPYGLIIGKIKWYSDKLNIPAEIFEICAEACQLQIDHLRYPELVDLSNNYHEMAGWYWRAKNKSKAIDAEQKAIKELKKEKGFSKKDMNAFESQLQQYKNM